MAIVRSKNKAFTLIELLAVIVILALVIVIAVPTVLKTIASAKKGAIESDAKLIIDAIEKKKASDDSFIYTDIKESNIEEKLGIKNTNYKSIEVTEVDGKPSVVIEGQNKYDGYTAYGTYESVEVVASDEYVPEEETEPSNYVESEGVNKPKLVTGMTAIKWNGSTWVDVANPDTDTSWYDYTNKEWANAKTADGSYWVWIPRYIYKISTGWHTNTVGTIDIQFTKDANDNWNSGVIGNISTDTTANASNNTWTNHPAFTFGATELTGIWVSKFEPSVSNTADACYTSESVANCDKTTLTPKFIPSARSWRYISVGNVFTVSRNMEINNLYGWGTSGVGIDTHLMKNVEWGAVAYLSKSIYGQDTNEIWVNAADDFTTGCAGYTDISPIPTSGCVFTYETANGVKASTTRTIYGIYDISGGAPEFVSAYVNNGHSNLATYGNSIVTANSKYKDVYTLTTDTDANNYSNAINQKGDAVYETSSSYTGTKSWFGDYSYMPNTNAPWFVRGGLFASMPYEAGAFNFDVRWGNAINASTFRLVLAVNAGL